MKTTFCVFAVLLALLQGAQGEEKNPLHRYNPSLVYMARQVEFAATFPNSERSKQIIAEYRAQVHVAYQRWGAALAPQVEAITGEPLVLEKEPEKLAAQVRGIQSWLDKRRNDQLLSESARLKEQQDLKNQLWLMQQEIVRIRNQGR
jgi:hypothetical protein